MAETAEFGLGK